MSFPPHRPLATLLALGVIASILFAPSAAGAEGEEAEAPQTWGVAPATAEGPDGRGAFEYIVEPNDVYEDHVAVRNFGEQPLTVTVYAQDAVQSVENSFEVLTPDEEARRIGAWLDIEGEEVTVPPRENVVLPFSIAVPADAEPGDHAGAIVAVSTPSEGEGATLQYRVGSRVHLRVAGPVEAAIDVDRLDGSYETRWSPFTAAPLDIEATLANTGNVRVSPDAVVTVSSVFGWWSMSGPLEGIEEILPEGAQSGGARLNEVLPLGPLWVSVEIPVVRSAGQDVTGLTEIASRTVVVWAVPWVLVAAVVLLLLAGLLAVRNIRRRATVARVDEGRK